MSTDADAEAAAAGASPNTNGATRHAKATPATTTTTGTRRIAAIHRHVGVAMQPVRSAVSALSGVYHGLFGALPNTAAHGGELVARVLKAHGVKWVFTLSGGHISPILVAATNTDGIRVVDVRHEVNAVFAADCVGRLTGVPGVAAVTAGPGITNTVTAVQNAVLAQSPPVKISQNTLSDQTHCIAQL